MGTGAAAVGTSDWEGAPIHTPFTQDEGDRLMGRYPPGTPVNGVVQSRQVYGVWVSLDEFPNVPALLEIIHFAVIESRSARRVQFPDDYPEVGARVHARILGWSQQPKDVRLTQLSHLEWTHGRAQRGNA
jgi:ribosomal protein S1